MHGFPCSSELVLPKVSLVYGKITFVTGVNREGRGRRRRRGRGREK